MAGLANTSSGNWRRSPGRLLLWSIPVVLLLLPAIAMRFTTEVVWDETDFIAMAAILFLAAGAFDLAARANGSRAQRAGAAIAILAAFLIVWINLAVGMIGDEDNPYNLLFLGAIAVALAGTLLARFRPAGTARAMLAAGAVQAAVATGGLTAEFRGGVLSGAMAGLWVVSAWLFWRSGRPQA